MPEARTRVALAFDFGLKRIGIASGDTLTRTASPRNMIPVHVAGPDWTLLDREVRAYAPDLLVVGAPYNDDGTPSRVAAAADTFADQLAKRYGLPVERVDERYSSTSAASLLREQRADGSRRKAVRKGDIDSAAAAIILESWLTQERT
jgi:putative holliday junction resolvase